METVVIVYEEMVRKNLEKRVMVEANLEPSLKVFHRFGHRRCEGSRRRDNQALGIDVELRKNNWMAVVQFCTAMAQRPTRNAQMTTHP